MFVFFVTRRCLALLYSLLQEDIKFYCTLSSEKIFNFIIFFVVRIPLFEVKRYLALYYSLFREDT